MLSTFYLFFPGNKARTPNSIRLLSVMLFNCVWMYGDRYIMTVFQNKKDLNVILTLWSKLTLPLVVI